MAPQRVRPRHAPSLVETIPPLHLYRYTTATPTGDVFVLVDEDGAVRHCNWTDCETDGVLRLRRAYQPQDIVIEEAAVPIAAAEEEENTEDSATSDVRSDAIIRLRRYFSCGVSPYSGAAVASRQEKLHALLHDVPVRFPPSSTPFFKDVWTALREVRPGETTTYGTLAGRCRRPNACQAAGQAMRGNHVCIFLPCHRVVGASRALTGFGPGLWRKAWLLRHEQAAIPTRLPLQQHMKFVQANFLKRERE